MTVGRKKGTPKTGGRKKGSVNKATPLVREAVLKATAAGITPLEYMLHLMREEPPEGADPVVKVSMRVMRFEAAKAAAPYVHPRLTAVEHTGKDGAPIEFREVVRRVV